MKEKAGLAILCDANGNVTQVLSEMPGVSESIQIGMPFTRMVAPGDLQKALSFLLEIRNRGVAVDWEINTIYAGNIVTLNLIGSKVNDALLVIGDRNADYLYDEISRLNNELVSAQRELIKKNIELELLNKEKNHFLGMAAHDLHNPLYVIRSASDLLLDPDLVSDKATQLELLRSIRFTSEFMSHLVNDLLDVAKIEAGELNLDLASVDLSALLIRNATFNRPLAARKQIELVYKLQMIPLTTLDSVKMEQVLNNLIGNAVKYSKPGDKIEISLEPAGENFVLSVKDNGIGISPEKISTLFKPFQRGEKGTQGEKSTGLGLAIVHRIVEGHGGNIWVESKVGHGTTFYVSIPLRLEKL